MSLTLTYFFIALIVLLLCLCFFFAGSETGMMALNRYRLRHAAKQGNRRAQRALHLLHHPDRLLNTIITGNTCATIVASSILTTVVGHYFGSTGTIIATTILTLVILLFCEALPKSIAALKPERFALTSVYPLQGFIYLFSPLVWFIHQFVKALLRLFGVGNTAVNDHLSADELHTLIKDSSSSIPESYQHMLLHVLEMERLTVSDIMIPKQDLVIIDFDEDAQDIIQLILNAPYNYLPVFQKDMTEILGFVKIRAILPNLLSRGDYSKEDLTKHLLPAYIVPETTSLHKQLLNFKRLKKRTALVVDEYGEFLGMITLEDVLEEIVGEFTTDSLDIHPDIIPEEEGSFLVSGQVSLRALNRHFKWHLPLKGPKTLGGYLIEYLQRIPENRTCLLLQDHPVEILQVADNRIKLVRLYGKRGPSR